MQINRPLAANKTRFHARHYLEIQEKQEAEYFFQKVSNNRIRIRAGVGGIKVVRRKDGDPPPPNNAYTNKKFYKQDSLPYQLPLTKDFFKPFEVDQWPSFADSPEKLHLIFCWEADAFHRFSQISLMCPRTIWKYRQSAEVFWLRVIPAPNLASLDVPDINARHEDVDDLEVLFGDSEDQTDTNDN